MAYPARVQSRNCEEWLNYKVGNDSSLVEQLEAEPFDVCTRSCDWMSLFRSVTLLICWITSLPSVTPPAPVIECYSVMMVGYAPEGYPSKYCRLLDWTLDHPIRLTASLRGWSLREGHWLHRIPTSSLKRKIRQLSNLMEFMDTIPRWCNIDIAQ